MKRLIFYGCSDDTFGEYGSTGVDHDNCANGKRMRFHVGSVEGTLYVIGHYSPGGTGTWMVGVQPVDESIPLPPWPMRIRASADRSETPYSTVLEIEAPDDVTVRYGK